MMGVRGYANEIADLKEYLSPGDNFFQPSLCTIFYFTKKFNRVRLIQTF